MSLNIYEEEFAAIDPHSFNAANQAKERMIKADRIKIQNAKDGDTQNQSQAPSVRDAGNGDVSMDNGSVQNIDNVSNAQIENNRKKHEKKDKPNKAEVA